MGRPLASASPDAMPDALPVFPLSGVLLLPRGQLPLNIFEPRYLAMVDDSLRGTGVGRQLMSRAMEFVDGRFLESYLWTFKGLDAARHLYESFSFRLAEESEGAQWGTKVVEQRFNRPRAK